MSALFCNARTIQFQEHAWSLADRAERAWDRMGLQITVSDHIPGDRLIPGPIFNFVRLCDGLAPGAGNCIVTDPRDENKVRL